jgi:hypothetical protein
MDSPLRGKCACGRSRRSAQRSLDAALSASAVLRKRHSQREDAASRCGLSASTSTPASHCRIRRAIRKWERATSASRRPARSARAPLRHRKRQPFSKRPPRLSSSHRAQRHSAAPRRKASPRVGGPRSPYPCNAAVPMTMDRAPTALSVSPGGRSRVVVPLQARSGSRPIAA